jgi:hypothetical protein
VSGSAQPVSIVVNEDTEPRVFRSPFDITTNLFKIIQFLELAEECARNPDGDMTEGWESLKAAIKDTGDLMGMMMDTEMMPNTNIYDGLEIAVGAMRVGMYHYLQLLYQANTR